MISRSVQTVAAALSLVTWWYSGAASSQTPADNPLHLSPPNTITMTVANLDREVEWYTKVLGFRQTVRFHETPDEELRRLEIDGYKVDLVWHKGSSRPPAAQYQEGYDHVTFPTNALEQDYRWLAAHDVKVRVDRDAQSNAIRRLVIHDPEGNEIRLEPKG